MTLYEPTSESRGVASGSVTRDRVTLVNVFDMLRPLDRDRKPGFWFQMEMFRISDAANGGTGVRVSEGDEALKLALADVEDKCNKGKDFDTKTTDNGKDKDDGENDIKNDSEDDQELGMKGNIIEERREAFCVDVTDNIEYKDNDANEQEKCDLDKKYCYNDRKCPSDYKGKCYEKDAFSCKDLNSEESDSVDSERTYENGDSNNNVVDQPQNEGKNGTSTHLGARIALPEKNKITTEKAQSNVNTKSKSITLVSGYISSSGIDGSSEISDSDEETESQSQNVRVGGIVYKVIMTNKYTPLSATDEFSDSTSEGESEMTRRCQKERMFLEEDQMKRKCAFGDVHRRSIKPLPCRYVVTHKNASVKDTPPATDLSEKRDLSDTSSESAQAEWTLAGIESCSEAGLTSTDAETNVSTMPPTRNQTPMSCYAKSQNENSMEEDPCINFKPLRQASYKIAVTEGEMPPPSLSKTIPVVHISPPKTFEAEISSQVKENINQEKSVPQKKPFTRKISYEMAVRGGEISESTSSVTLNSERGHSESVKSLLELKELDKRRILHMKPAKLQNRNPVDTDRSESERISSKDKVVEKKPEERAAIESNGESPSDDNSTPMRYSDFEKILPLGGFLTLIKGKPPSVSSGSQSGSIYSLPWDNQSLQIGTEAQSSGSHASSVSARHSSSPTSIEELLYIIKDNVTSNNLTKLKSSADAKDQPRDSSTPKKDIQVRTHKEKESIPRILTLEEKRKAHLEQKRVAESIRALWLKEGNFENMESKFLDFFSKCLEYQEYWPECKLCNERCFTLWISGIFNIDMSDHACLKEGIFGCNLIARSFGEKLPSVQVLREKTSKADKNTETKNPIADLKCPFDEIMETVLNDQSGTVNKIIIEIDNYSSAKIPTNLAKQFNVGGETILLENDITICSECNVVSLQILWARQIIARLNNRSTYANVPPYAENLAVIRRLLAKKFEQIIQKIEKKRVSKFQSKKRSIDNKNRFKRRKGSKKKVSQFVKGAIEAIPELDELSPEDHEEPIYLEVIPNSPEKSMKAIKFELKPESHENNRKGSEKRMTSIEAENDSEIKAAEEEKSQAKCKRTKKVKLTKRLFDNRSTGNKYSRTISLNCNDRNFDYGPCKHNKLYFTFRNQQELEDIIYVKTDKMITEKKNDETMESRAPVGNRNTEECIRKKSHVISWRNVWKNKKIPNESDKRAARFLTNPQSMNLIQHKHGRLEVLYGEAREYPFTVGEYSLEDGRYLTLEELFLKKYYCYEPPNDYFFSVRNKKSNLTAIKMIKESNFFPSIGRKSDFYPPIYTFQPTTEQGGCPNKRMNTAKLFKQCKEIFMRTEVPTLEDRDFVENLSGKKPKHETQTSVKHKSFRPCPPIPVLPEFDEPPPKVSPKPVKTSLLWKPYIHNNNNTESPVVTNPRFMRLLRQIQGLPPGMYFYPYQINDIKPYLLFRIDVFVDRIVDVTTDNSLGHPIVQRLCEKYIPSEGGELDRIFKNVILRLRQSEDGVHVQRYTFRTSPPTPLSDGEELTFSLETDSDSDSNASEFASEIDSETNNASANIDNASVTSGRLSHNVQSPCLLEERKEIPKQSLESVPKPQLTETYQLRSHPIISPHSIIQNTIKSTEPVLSKELEEKALILRQRLTKSTTAKPQLQVPHHSWSYPSTTVHSPISSSKSERTQNHPSEIGATNIRKYSLGTIQPDEYKSKESVINKKKLQTHSQEKYVHRPLEYETGELQAHFKKSEKQDENVRTLYATKTSLPYTASKETHQIAGENISHTISNMPINNTNVCAKHTSNEDSILISKNVIFPGPNQTLRTCYAKDHTHTYSTNMQKQSKRISDINQFDPKEDTMQRPAERFRFQPSPPSIKSHQCTEVYPSTSRHIETSQIPYHPEQHQISPLYHNPSEMYYVSPRHSIGTYPENIHLRPSPGYLAVEKPYSNEFTEFSRYPATTAVTQKQFEPISLPSTSRPNVYSPYFKEPQYDTLKSHFEDFETTFKNHSQPSPNRTFSDVSHPAGKHINPPGASFEMSGSSQRFGICPSKSYLNTCRHSIGTVSEAIHHRLSPHSLIQDSQHFYINPNFNSQSSVCPKHNIGTSPVKTLTAKTYYSSGFKDEDKETSAENSQCRISPSKPEFVGTHARVHSIPTRRSVGTSPENSQPLLETQMSNPFKPETPCFEIDPYITASSTPVKTHASASRHSIGTPPEKLEITNRSTDEIVEQRPEKSLKTVTFPSKYISRSSENIPKRVHHQITHHQILVKEGPSTYKEKKVIYQGTKTKYVNRSNEDIAERIAYHYLLEGKDTETVFYKEYTKESKENKKCKAKQYSKRYRSRSNEDIAERIAHHYLVKECDEENGFYKDTSPVSSRTIISSIRTSQSCPVPSSPNVSENSHGAALSTISAPFLWCATQVHDCVESTDKNDPPLNKKRAVRTRTV